LYPGQVLRLSAQTQRLDFYRRLGFASVGEPYLEDQIPHIDMLLGSSAHER
jgi:ElaA protein